MIFKFSSRHPDRPQSFPGQRPGAFLLKGRLYRMPTDQPRLQAGSDSTARNHSLRCIMPIHPKAVDPPRRRAFYVVV